MLLHNSVNVPLGATVGLKNLHITLNALLALMPPSLFSHPKHLYCTAQQVLCCKRCSRFIYFYLMGIYYLCRVFSSGFEVHSASSELFLYVFK